MDCETLCADLSCRVCACRESTFKSKSKHSNCHLLFYHDMHTPKVCLFLSLMWPRPASLVYLARVRCAVACRVPSGQGARAAARRSIVNAKVIIVVASIPARSPRQRTENRSRSQLATRFGELAPDDPTPGSSAPGAPKYLALAHD